MPEPKRATADPKLPARPDAALAIRRLRRQLAEALAKIEVLQACADTDFLLGVLNRRGFERELNRAIAYIRRYPATGALIVLDVDRLKPINDAFGHAAGDDVLKAVVGVLQQHVRASDVIGRLSGDEFVLLLWNLTEIDVLAKAALLEAAIDRLRFTFKGRTVSAGASAGVALLGLDADGADLLAQADRAMYARKAERKGTSGTAADSWIREPIQYPELNACSEGARHMGLVESKRPVVLIVEDEFLLRLEAVDMIEAAGFDVVEAVNADEAIAILESRFDITVVFTDIQMPGSMDGLKLAQAVRGRWPPIKIIATSGRVSAIQKNLPEGGRLLSKPYSPKQVTGVLRELTAA